MSSASAVGEGVGSGMGVGESVTEAAGEDPADGGVAVAAATGVSMIGVEAGPSVAVGVAVPVGAGVVSG